MKITSNSPASARSSAASKTGASDNAAQKGTSSTLETASGLDLVEIAGVAEAELTPKVRAALQSLMAEVESLRADVHALQAQVREAQALADTDPMLPILNRRAFVRDLDRTLSMVTRYQTTASLVFVDVNGLKTINDRYGHPAGDEALRHVAHIIAENIRGADSFGRLGGDEFGLLLLQADETIAVKKMTDLAEKIAAPTLGADEARFNVSIAFGVVVLDTTLDGTSAMAKADAAMYRKK